MSRWSPDAEIRKTIDVDATPEVVFKALTDTKELEMWMPYEAKFEARVGGSLLFKFHWSSRNVDTEVTGEIVELDPGRKLSYTWVSAMRTDRSPERLDHGPSALVTWTLEDLPGNRTRVSLVQKGFDERFREDGESGWSYFVSQLSRHLHKVQS